MKDEIKERAIAKDIEAVDADPATLEGDCARCSAAMYTEPEDEASPICDCCAQLIAVRLSAAVRERDMVVNTLSHATMKAHEDIAAGKFSVASNRLALALSLVVPP